MPEGLDPHWHGIILLFLGIGTGGVAAVLGLKKTGATIILLFALLTIAELGLGIAQLAVAAGALFMLVGIALEESANK